jgi:hypothetical protein
MASCMVWNLKPPTDRLGGSENSKRRGFPVLDSSLSMRRFGRYLLCGRVSWASSLQLYQAADEGIGKQYQRFSTTQAMRALFPLQQ